MPPHPATWPKKRLAMLFTPANLHSAGDDRQSGPTGGGYYYLADDGAGPHAPQG